MRPRIGRSVSSFDVRQHGDHLTREYHAGGQACPGCRTPLPPHAVFCIDCGLTQLDETDTGTVVRHVPGPPTLVPFEGTIELSDEDLEPLDEAARTLRMATLAAPEPTHERRRPPYVLDPALVAAVREGLRRDHPQTVPSDPVVTTPWPTEPSVTVRRAATTPPRRPRRATAPVPMPPKRGANLAPATRPSRVTLIVATVLNPPPAEDPAAAAVHIPPPHDPG